MLEAQVAALASLPLHLDSLSVCPPRVLDPPHWQDLLPLKLSVWVYLSVKSLPQTVQVGQAPPTCCCPAPSGSPVCVSGGEAAL